MSFLSALGDALSPTKRRPRKVGLALGSGGARGFSHLGVLRRFEEWGLGFHCVAGTSMGAIMGAIYVGGGLAAAGKWAKSLDWLHAARLFSDANFLNPLNFTKLKYGLCEGAKIEAKIAEFVEPRRFEDCATPFATVATDVATGEEVVLRRGNLLEAVHASYTIPGVFSPVNRSGRQLVDGGLVNPVPISVCRKMGADAVVAVDINLRPGPENLVHESKRLSMIDILVNTTQIMQNEVTSSTIARQAPDVLVQPAVGSIGTLEFRYVNEAIEAGVAAADEMRPAIEQLFAN